MRVIRAAAIGIVLVGALAAAAYFGWSRLESQTSERDEKAKPTEVVKPDPSAPPIPGETVTGKKEELGSKELVTEKAVRERKRKTGYIYDPKIMGGTVKGVCTVKYDKPVRLYPTFPVELEGENAVRGPRKGELDEYKSRKPMPIRYLDPYFSKEKRYGVKGAVVMIRGVEAGPRRNFDRLRYQVDFRDHQIVPAKPQGRGVFNPSAYGVGVMRVKQLVQVLNLSIYDSHLTLTNVETGKVLWDRSVPGYRDPNFPGEHLGFNPVMKRPEVYQVPRIEDKGIYKLSCRRHPWQRAYLVLWDSPYVTVSTGTHDRRRLEKSGEFSINGIPEGKYTVEVWHPEFEPVKRTHEIEITIDRTTPLTVEFKVPDVLTQKPKPLPAKPVAAWALVGPFYPLMDEEPDAPNNNLDFNATYDGMDEEIRWKYIDVGRGRRPGYVELHKVMWRIRELSLSYYAIRIKSPKAQRLYLGVHNQANSLRMWLNGKVIFKSYTGDFGRYARYAGRFIVTGDLKAGENTLLVLISAERTEHSSFSINYRAEDVTLEVPVRNARPQGRRADATCPEGGDVRISLPVVDADHVVRRQTLKATVTKGPAHGDLTRQDATTFVYHARRGRVGKDVFTWKPEDGTDAGRPVQATITITPDTSPPRIVKVVAKAGKQTVRVQFSEPVAAASATNVANWSIGHGVTIKGAALADDQTTVTLSASPLSGKVNAYTLTVRGIKDRARAANSANGTCTFRALELQPGLRYAYYAQTPKGEDLKHFDAMKPTRTGVAKQIGLTKEIGALGAQFSLRFDGKIKVPADGTYTFYTTSDDGSRLYIDGRPVVKNDGVHGMVEASGKQELAAGLHPVTVTFCQRGAGMGLVAAWSGPGVKKQAIPADVLCHTPR